MDMMKMMKKANRLQKEMKKKKKTLADQEVEFSSKCGRVTLTATCDLKMKSISISPQLVNPEDIKPLEKTVLDAMRGVLDLAQKQAAQEMKSLTAGMDLPF